jgi:hypothetical protein
MEGEKEYVKMMQETATILWGAMEAEKMRSHIETTAKAVYRIASIEIGVETEPATKLRHKG